jgi:hypothetical protein
MDNRCEYVGLVAKDSWQSEILPETDDPSKVEFVGFQLAQVRPFVDVRHESKAVASREFWDKVAYVIDFCILWSEKSASHSCCLYSRYTHMLSGYLPGMDFLPSVMYSILSLTKQSRPLALYLFLPLLIYILYVWERQTMLGGSLVTTAWRVLRLWIERRPPVLEGSCEHIE